MLWPRVYRPGKTLYYRESPLVKVEYFTAHTPEAEELFQKWSKDFSSEMFNREQLCKAAHRVLSIRGGARGVRDLRDAFVRTVYLAINREVPAEYREAEMIGEWVNSCSESKSVRKEVQDLFFSMLSDYPEESKSTVFIKAISTYNRMHGYAGRRD